MKKIDILNELNKKNHLFSIIESDNKVILISFYNYKFTVFIKNNIPFKTKRKIFSIDRIAFYDRYILFSFNYNEHMLNIKVNYNQISKISISKIKVLNSKEIVKNVL